MAIRTGVLRNRIRFDTSTGPRGKNNPMGSDTELIQRLGRQEHKGWHVREAVVEYFIREGLVLFLELP